jgi:hypothetical protein
MDEMLSRYLDGDLTEAEGRAFLRAVETDRGLEAELRRYEQMLVLGERLPRPVLPDGFTQSVMQELGTTDTDRVKHLGGRTRRSNERIRPRTSRSWGMGPWMRVAVAASVVAFAGGIALGRLLDGNSPAGSTTPMATTATPTMVPAEDALQLASATPGNLRTFRLVYVPSDPTVTQVTVAGSFNDWNPERTPLRKTDGVWTTVLVLAPGTYEYMFVEDDQRWVTDPLATVVRDDGFGGKNAVLDVSL